jgi:predicted ATPase
MAATSIGDHGTEMPVPLVGRAHELAVLRDRLGLAVARRGSLVLLGGEAGIGKSTLVEAIAREATAASCLVVTGHCYDLTATPPYGPWQGLTPHAAEPLPAPLAAALAALAGSAEVGGQGALFARVRDGLAAVVAARPVVVVLEDLHWADPASLDLLRVLTRRPGAVPLLLIVTYRVDELTRRHPLYQLIPVLVREAGAERIDLRRLDEGALRTLVAGQYPLADADVTRLVAHLQDHADGNPLYARELLRTLEEEGVLRPNGAGWQLGDLDRVRVPPLVQQVIDGRVARLGEEAREALALAAVIGQDVPLDLWGRSGGGQTRHCWRRSSGRSRRVC